MFLSLCSTTTEDWVRNGTLKGETFQRGAKPTQWQYRTHRRPVGCCQWGVFDGAAGESALSMDVVDSNTLPHFHARCVRITSNKSDMVMRMMWDARVVVVESNDERGNRGNSILLVVTRQFHILAETLQLGTTVGLSVPISLDRYSGQTRYTVNHAVSAMFLPGEKRSSHQLEWAINCLPTSSWHVAGMFRLSLLHHFELRGGL